jgi:hypothetical protein
MLFKTGIPLLFSAALLGCAQISSIVDTDQGLSIVPILAGDTPDMYGSRLVAWYPELDKAIIKVETGAGLRTQGLVEDNENQIRLLETRQAALALGMPVSGLSMNTWSSGWNAWSSGWEAGSSGQTSALEISHNRATWAQIRLPQGQMFFNRRWCQSRGDRYGYRFAAPRLSRALGSKR